MGAYAAHKTFYTSSSNNSAFTVIVWKSERWTVDLNADVEEEWINKYKNIFGFMLKS